MDKIKRPFKMVVTGDSDTHPERIAYDAAQLKWSEIHLVSDREWKSPGLIRHSQTPRHNRWGMRKLSLSVKAPKPGSLVIFEKCRTKESLELMTEFFIHRQLRNISVIIVDDVTDTVPNCDFETDALRVFTSKPLRDWEWPRLFLSSWPYLHDPRVNGDLVMKRSMGRVILADPGINWDAVARLRTLSEVHSELRSSVFKRCT